MAARFTSNLEGFEVMVNQIMGRARRVINDQMRDEMTKVKELAQEMAPIDHGPLESAIKVRSEDRRSKWVVYIDGEVAAFKPGKTVGDYADELHEGMNWKLGPRSALKNRVVSSRVGEKFLERAWNRLSPGILVRLARAAKAAGI